MGDWGREALTWGAMWCFAGGLCVGGEILVIWGRCPFIADEHISVDLDLLRLVSVVLWADLF